MPFDIYAPKALKMFILFCDKLLTSVLVCFIVGESSMHQFSKIRKKMFVVFSHNSIFKCFNLNRFFIEEHVRNVLCHLSIRLTTTVLK